MNELQTQPSGEPTSASPDTLAQYEQLTNPEAVSQFAERIAGESQQFNFEAETASIADRETDLSAQITQLAGDTTTSEAQLTEQLRVKQNELDNLSLRKREAGNVNDFMQTRARVWETSGTMLFNSAEADAQPLINGIASDAQTEESEFVPEAIFNEAADDTKPTIAIDAAAQPIEVPLSAVVSAVGFQSWAKGRGESVKKDDKSSGEVIEDYASRSTDIPPVDSAKALILPDGKVVVMTHNAHRVAAAKLKGQSTIQIKYLEISKATQTLGTYVKG